MKFLNRDNPLLNNLFTYLQREKEIKVLEENGKCATCKHLKMEKYIPRCLKKKKVINLNSYCREYHELKRDPGKKVTASK